ncbi:cytochrome P-450 cyp509A1 [Gongronella butleri]|nr:cytochrome P-450 cyp509A1 [Gongronella butleri]
MSQLLPAVQQLNDYIKVDKLLELYEKHVARYTNTRGKRVSIGVAVALLYFARAVYKKAMPPKNIRHIPHVSYFKFMRQFLIEKKSTYEMFKDLYEPIMAKTNGFYLKPERAGWVVEVSNPTAVKQIFMKSNDLFPKLQFVGFEGTYNQAFLGRENILSTNGATWKKHRKLANPAFHRAMPIKLFGRTAIELFEMLDQQHPDQDVFVAPFGNLMERVTLDIIGLAGFDFKFNATQDEHSEWKTVYDQVVADTRDLKFVFFPFLEQKLRFLFPARQAAFKRLDKFVNMLQHIIETKRKTLKDHQNNGIEEGEKDLLTLMLEGELRGEGALTSDDLLGNLIIFFIAGHDTTANALNAAIYWLSRHPEIQQKARDEVNSILCPEGEVKGDIIPTLEQTKEFVYINKIMKETLRNTNPVLSLVTPRVATEDTELAGHFIPKGTLVNVNMYDLHHNEDVWKNPYEFNPDRFDDGGEAEQNAQGGLAWTPFANGSRQCIGMNFSLVEQRVFLAMLLRRYEFSLPADSIHKEMYKSTNTLISSSIDLNIQMKKRF